MSDTVNVPLSEYVGLLRENDALKGKVERLKEVLKGLLKTTEGDCRLDHHGNCQTHGLNTPCEVALARKLLQE